MAALPRSAWTAIYHRAPCRLAQRPTTAARLSHKSAKDKEVPTPPPLEELKTSFDHEDARTWLARFKSSTIAKDLVECTFARSSGPGGQNVNKVNTKAVVRCSIDSPWIPAWAKAALEESPYYVKSSQSILVNSTVFRSQSQNVDDCLSKLHTLVHDASAASIKNDPSEEQRKKVLAFEKAEKIKNRKEKEHRAEVKNIRGSGKRISPDF